MSKMIGRCSAPMPTPVSLTSITRASFCTVRRTRTCPSLVNLKALLTRLRTTSETLARSVMMRWARSSGVSHSKATPGARGRPAVLACSALRRAPIGTAELTAVDGAPVLEPPGGDEARHPAAAEERDGDPGARAPAARQPQRAHGRAIADQQLAACDRLLEPREVLEAEAPVADGVQVRLGDAVAARDAEGSRAFVEAGGDRPGQL